MDSVAPDIDREMVTLYVGGDGGSWSCSPSILYRIPTDAFDYYMLLGRLNTPEDLQQVMEEVAMKHHEDQFAPDTLSECTDVWVFPCGTEWSGYPSSPYELPRDVFMYLQEKGDTEKTIGRLKSAGHLASLIDNTRKEMVSGVLEAVVITKTRPKNIENKLCGHMCTMSSMKEVCCACADLRPIKPDSELYPMYLDGTGWVDGCSRGAGYCPYCQC